MPSRTRRRNYRGGGDNLSRCKKWADKKLITAKGDSDQCEKMIEHFDFPSESMFGTYVDPVTREDMSDISLLKGAKLTDSNWDKIYNYKVKGIVPASVASVDPNIELNKKIQSQRSSYNTESLWKTCDEITPDGQFKIRRPGKDSSLECNIYKCNAYDKQTGKNVIKNKDGTYSQICDGRTPPLPTCTQWKSIDQGIGIRKKWATVGPNGEFCNVANLDEDDNKNTTFSKLNTQSDEAVNSDRVTYPLRRHKTGIIYDKNNYDQYYGGKRSRRKSRKSRR